MSVAFLLMCSDDLNVFFPSLIRIQMNQIPELAVASYRFYCENENLLIYLRFGPIVSLAQSFARHRLALDVSIDVCLIAHCACNLLSY